MLNIRERTSSGIFWTSLDIIGNKGLNLLIGIILARVLSPAEFGLVAVVLVVITMFDPFIDSGFYEALIRKEKCSTKDYSTVLWFNIGISLVLYFLIFLSASYIAAFYENPAIEEIIQVLGVILVVNGFSLVQRAKLTKDLSFRRQTLISAISVVISGGVAVWMVYNGYGIWSLVWKSILQSAIQSLLYWTTSSWTPKLLFSRSSFHEMFGFGSKLLGAKLINQLHRNLSYLVIGKYYSAASLGHYTQANQYYQFPTSSFMAVIQKVTYPVFSAIQKNDSMLESAYMKLLKMSMYIFFPAMLMLAAISKPLVVGLVGEKWLEAAIYLQIMCLSGVWYPMHALNLNILKLKGYSGLFLRLEVLKKIISGLLVLTAIVWDIKTMLIIGVFNSIFLTYLNSYFNDKLINVSFFMQLKAILNTIIISIIMFFAVYCLNSMLILEPLLECIVSLLFGVLMFFLLSRITRAEEMSELVDLTKHYYRKISTRVLKNEDTNI